MHPINFIFLCSAETCAAAQQLLQPVPPHQCSVPAPAALGWLVQQLPGAVGTCCCCWVVLHTVYSQVQKPTQHAFLQFLVFASLSKDRRKLIGVFPAATGVPVHYSSRLLEGPSAFHTKHLWQLAALASSKMSWGFSSCWAGDICTQIPSQENRVI